MKHHAVGVNQKVMVIAWHPRRKMREYQIIPSKVGDQTVGCCQIHAHLPFLSGDMGRAFIKQGLWICAHDIAPELPIIMSGIVNRAGAGFQPF